MGRTNETQPKTPPAPSLPTEPTPAAHTSRRELNRLATREAIANAGYELFREHGYAAVTIEMIAERAGVSRRTFFNYFASFDDALNVRVSETLERALEALDAQPPEMSLADAVVAAVGALATDEHLGPVAELSVQASRIPSLYASGLAVWDQTANLLTERIAERMPHADRFGLAVFTHAILGGAKAALQSWLPTVDGPLTSEDTQRLKTILTDAVGIVLSGVPQITSLPHGKSS